MKDHEHIADFLERAGFPRPVCELRFHPKRRWRFDLAWPDRMVAIETQGGAWVQFNAAKGRNRTGNVKGGHTTPLGYENDCEKLNAAQQLGWKCFWVLPAWWNDGRAVSLIEETIGLKELGLEKGSEG